VVVVLVVLVLSAVVGRLASAPDALAALPAPGTVPGTVVGPPGTYAPTEDIDVHVVANGGPVTATANGAVPVSGTVSCSASATVSLSVRVSQAVVGSYGSAYVEPAPCDGTPHGWSTLVTGAPMPFGDGPAALDVSAWAYSQTGYGSGEASASLTISGSPANGDPVYYVALGDSLATGFAAGPGEGYVDLLQTHLRKRYPNIVLVNFGCSSETTTTMLDGSICRFGGLSQQAAAVAFLQAHHDRVVALTIDIGGNDLVFCTEADCAHKNLATVDANLATIMSQLRAAAGPTVPFYGMTYFDPLLNAWLTDDAGKQWARLTVQLADELNQHLVADYLAAGAPSADVAGKFAIDDFSTMVPSEWGTIPVNVYNACRWLDITCRAGGPQGFGDDANAAGYVVIASAFEEVMDAPPPTPTPPTPAPQPTPTDPTVLGTSTGNPAAATAVPATPSFTG
jgi:lysophospholipase L1-like esterase